MEELLFYFHSHAIRMRESMINTSGHFVNRSLGVPVGGAFTSTSTHYRYRYRVRRIIIRCAKSADLPNTPTGRPRARLTGFLK